MRDDGGGRIVNVASIGGLVAVPHLLSYSASKFALVGVSQGLRSELAKDDVVVTTVCPLLTWSAPRAAERIVLACRRGEGRVVLGFPAKVLATLDALMPDLMAQAMALTARLLPAPPANGSRASKTGAESESPLTRGPLLALNRRAEITGNERHN